jgi:hypothetical protein
VIGLGFRPSHLIAALLGLVGLDNLLTLRFLGIDPWWAWLTGGVALAALCTGIARPDLGEDIPLKRFILCIAVGLVVMLLGGEGRVFYANNDWIIRDAVMGDMVRSPWPFAYAGHGAPVMLRAPIGMYLLPALAGKLGGQAGSDWALLVQNGLMLGTLLALGSLLFATPRARWIALPVVLLFSGMDTLGELVIDPSILKPLTNHIEGWAIQSVYCANLTSVLWAPQHALAGWIGAVLFLMWRTGRAPLGTFLAAIPLTLIWSPLAAASVLPFAAIAGIQTLWRRRLTRVDIAIPLVALALATIPILYMHAGAAKVSTHVNPQSLPIYLLFECLEGGVWLVAIWLLLRGGRFGIATYAVSAAMLLSACFVQIGMGADFAMRTTLAPIAILSVLAADLLSGAGSRRAMPWLILVFLIGALTPAREIGRAVAYRSTPTLRCDLWAAWDFSFRAFPKATYLARRSDLPSFMRRTAPTLAPPVRSERCWAGYWQTPRFQ